MVDVSHPFRSGKDVPVRLQSHLAQFLQRPSAEHAYLRHLPPQGSPWSPHAVRWVRMTFGTDGLGVERRWHAQCLVLLFIRNQYFLLTLLWTTAPLWPCSLFCPVNFDLLSQWSLHLMLSLSTREKYPRWDILSITQRARGNDISVLAVGHWWHEVTAESCSGPVIKTGDTLASLTFCHRFTAYCDLWTQISEVLWYFYQYEHLFQGMFFEQRVFLQL